MVMSHNLHTNLGNWCIFPENKLIYQGKWLKPQIVSGGEIMIHYAQGGMQNRIASAEEDDSLSQGDFSGRDVDETKRAGPRS